MFNHFTSFFNSHIHCCHRNKQKAAQNARHEAEKLHMQQRQDVGLAVGEYQGRGQGENLQTEAEPMDAVEMDFESGDEDDPGDNTETTVLPSNERPLLFFFDVETTGLVVYNDVIIDIAAKVVDIPPSAVSQLTYQSLLRTSKTVPARGRNTQQ